MNFFFHKEAENEFNNAIDYYEAVEACLSVDIDNVNISDKHKILEICEIQI